MCLHLFNVTLSCGLCDPACAVGSLVIYDLYNLCAEFARIGHIHIAQADDATVANTDEKSILDVFIYFYPKYIKNLNRIVSR